VIFWVQGSDVRHNVHQQEEAQSTEAPQPTTRASGI
jgi:hypothetical protein